MKEESKNENNFSLNNDTYENIFKHMDSFINKGLNLYESRKTYESMEDSEQKQKAMKKFEMLKDFLENFNNL